MDVVAAIYHLSNRLKDDMIGIGEVDLNNQAGYQCKFGHASRLEVHGGFLLFLSGKGCGGEAGPVLLVLGKVCSVRNCRKVFG